jgi:uncharacterized protein YutE (UPF0331/DUF86 family)
MNEQIKDLFEQSCFETEYDDNQNLPEMVERFAELIVKQCADICLEMAAKCGGIPGDGALAKDCAYWIKQHFGVEE